MTGQDERADPRAPASEKCDLHNGLRRVSTLRVGSDLYRCCAECDVAVREWAARAGVPVEVL